MNQYPAIINIIGGTFICAVLAVALLLAVLLVVSLFVQLFGVVYGPGIAAVALGLVTNGLGVYLIDKAT